MCKRLALPSNSLQCWSAELKLPICLAARSPIYHASKRLRHTPKRYHRDTHDLFASQFHPLGRYERYSATEEKKNTWAV